MFDDSSHNANFHQVPETVVSWPQAEAVDAQIPPILFGRRDAGTKCLQMRPGSPLARTSLNGRVVRSALSPASQPQVVLHPSPGLLQLEPNPHAGRGEEESESLPAAWPRRTAPRCTATVDHRPPL